MSKVSSFSLVEEIISELQIDDSSSAALVDCLKKNSINYARIISHLYKAMRELTAATNAYNEAVNRRVSDFSRTGSPSGVAVTNFTKHEIPLLPDIKRAKELVDDLDDKVKFLRDVKELYRKHTDVLIQLTGLDVEMVVNQVKTNQAADLDLRESRKKWNKLEDMLSKPWGTTV